MCEHDDEWLYCYPEKDEYAAALLRVAHLLPDTVRATDRLARCFLSPEWPAWDDLVLADDFSEAVDSLPPRYQMPSLARHGEFLTLICGFMIRERPVDPDVAGPKETPT